MFSLIPQTLTDPHSTLTYSDITGLLEFLTEVLQAPCKVLVDFYGDGCVPCAALMPKIHAFAEQYGSDKLKFCCLNTTKARRLENSQKVLDLPVIAIYENGAMIDSCVKEEATPEKVEAMIKKYI